MTQDRNAFKLGLALLLFFVLFAAVLVFLAPRGGGDLVVRVRFPHHQMTTTLKSGSEVTCGGQTVGSISRLELQEMTDPGSGHKELFTVMTVRVDSSLGLRADGKMAPEGPILGGPGRLLILDRGVGAPVQANQMLEGQVAQDFAGLTRMLAAQLDPTDPTSIMSTVKTQLDVNDPKSLMAKIHASMADINAVTQSIRNETNPREKDVLLAKLHGILDNVNQATRALKSEVDRTQDGTTLAKVHRTLDTLNVGLNSVVDLLNQNKQPITDTITHVRKTSEILEQQIAARIARQLDPQEAAGLLAKVHVAIDSMQVSIRDINTITDDTKDLVALNKDYVNAVVLNMKETSDHLKAASKEIRRNPWRLFYQPTVSEAAQVNVYDAARAFSEAAGKLDDALTRLQAISAAGTDVGLEQKELKQLADQLNQSHQQFSKVESALWETLRIK